MGGMTRDASGRWVRMRDKEPVTIGYRNGTSVNKLQKTARDDTGRSSLQTNNPSAHDVAIRSETPGPVERHVQQAIMRTRLSLIVCNWSVVGLNMLAKFAALIVFIFFLKSVTEIDDWANFRRTLTHYCVQGSDETRTALMDVLFPAAVTTRSYHLTFRLAVSGLVNASAVQVVVPLPLRNPFILALVLLVLLIIIYFLSYLQNLVGDINSIMRLHRALKDELRD